MIIRKKYKFESSHIVRGCTSRRCSRNIHGHSYIVEVFLSSTKLDNAHMVVDFGLMKQEINDFIDSFDHSHIMYSPINNKLPVPAQKEMEYIINNTERWILMPLTPSAEGLSLLFFYVIDAILENTNFQNNEGEINLYSVRVHETATGYAQTFKEDLPGMWNTVLHTLNSITFSPQIMKEWGNKHWKNQILAGQNFKTPKIL